LNIKNFKVEPFERNNHYSNRNRFRFMELQNLAKDKSEHRQQKKQQLSGRMMSPPGGLMSPLLQLQRSLGNEVFGRFFQAKLTVNQPGDMYEQEADRVEEQVMCMPEPLPALSSSDDAIPHLQRKCAACSSGGGLCPKCAEEEQLQRKPLITSPLKGGGGMLQRQELENPEEVEEETLQAKEAPGAVPAVSPTMENHISALRGGGQPLPESVRAFFEPRFGYDFSQVRVHTDGQAAESARAVNARAYTLGRDVVFGAGEYAPDSAAGKSLLAHELTHVVQNRNYGMEAPIRRVCSPQQKRTNSDPNEREHTGGQQFPTDPCWWVLFGFDINSSEFKRAFTPAVNQLAKFLKTNPNAQLELLGLNDCFGSVQRNIKLGNMRSVSVMNAFPAQVHKQIKLQPSDGRSFLVSNDTPEQRAANRSVRIRVITKNGSPCPGAIPFQEQLSPRIASTSCTDDERKTVIEAAKNAVSLTITARARAHNWKSNTRTRQLLDFFFATTTDAERATAASRVAALLDSIIPALQRPLLDCIAPGHPQYSRICPNETIADAGGIALGIPTFCMPQFIELNPGGQAVTVIHELSHTQVGLSDIGKTYYTENECNSTSETDALTRDQRLKHADSFACFVVTTALQPPR